MPVGGEGALSEQSSVEIVAPPMSETTSNLHQRSMTSSPPELADDRTRRAAIVGQLAGGILHDFNNVLTVIIGMIDILSEGGRRQATACGGGAVDRRSRQPRRRADLAPACLRARPAGAAQRSRYQ